MSLKFKFAIDRGGTFTDVYAKCPDGKTRQLKLLSVDPSNYPDAPREGIRRILQEETGIDMPPSEKIDGDFIEWIRMGTTVATNALLERKGEDMALLINRGFKDLLFIGNQARPKIFDLEINTPEVLYKKVVEVDCRVVPDQKRCEMNHNWPATNGTTGEKLFQMRALDKEKLHSDLVQLKEEGIKSIAVVLMHSYMHIDDELSVGEIAKSVGFDHISLSHQVMPMSRIVARGFTACADAYLTPHIKKYVKSFASGFKNNLEGVNVLFMQSDGGLTPMEVFNGSRAILSGPAGGVVGYAMTTPGNQPVIGFDMGGTSTDVSRYSGTYEHVFESTIAGVTIQAPQLDVNTVAAGGGSCLFFRSGLFVVGPESAGAHPGPTCYRKGGPLTVTDANLCLGRLLPEYFPNIFGPDEKQPLDKEATVEAFRQLTGEINEYLRTQNPDCYQELPVEEIAIGFIRVANEAMCRPIRALTQAKGYDTRDHVLACFGGAGAQHACAVARSLGMSRVVVHKYAGILSAYGMALADVVEELQEPCAKAYKQENFKYVDERLLALSILSRKKLISQGFKDDQIICESYLHLRYEGTDCALMVSPSKSKNDSNEGPEHGDFKSAFLEKYQLEFGFTIPNREIVIDDIRIRSVGKTNLESDSSIEDATGLPIVDKMTEVYFEDVGYCPTKVYLFSNLQANHSIEGPSIIIDNLCTILVEPDCTALITKSGDIQIDIGSGKKKKIGTELDSVQLSIFSHRFMSIAEQMGRILQRTSISTNIKERLDFSCALFGPDGGLVSNAPHIPVHLGAMQETVQYQMTVQGNSIEEGDVILSNHPKAGGSHLPDLTVITPVFYKSEKRPVFFVASRGHHADIGGITPGSMPPHSKSLSEEGAAFKSFFLVKKGIFQQEKLTDAFMAPAKIPGSSGSRNLRDNIADLKAQIAANQKGINLVRELIDYYGLEVVQAYMCHIQSNAELAVRDMLRDIGRRTFEKTGKSMLHASDFLDDGSEINLTVNINTEEGSAICDFT
ncbi:hypothetical protein LSTR_LSTR012518 [Laodelphax striatellus]|uniref:5-oxoprolinase n=1 Tax=Laodelphax striatellus TaxID=195883 RepID=A0A482XKT6_LAOST|nr:hypothetical protein LSTR_LSTR012518 [Laodelphax striatellus]